MSEARALPEALDPADVSEANFRAALRVAGLTIAADRYPVLLAAYRDFQSYLAVLDRPFSYTDEPASTFRLETLGE